MIYEANTKQKYFTPTQKRHLENFMAQEPRVGWTYTNAKGEKRKPLRLFYPVGLITDLTAYEPRILSDGSRNYHTPCATYRNATKVRISYQDIDEGKACSCESDEWLKWAGSQCAATAPDEVVEEHPLLKAGIKNLERMFPVDEAKGDKYTKGAKWSKIKREPKL